MKRRWQVVATVASQSEPGVLHEIKRSDDGVLGCSCLAYRFAKGQKTCRHLAAFGAGSAPESRHQEAQRVVEVARERFTVTHRRAISLSGTL